MSYWPVPSLFLKRINQLHLFVRSYFLFPGLKYGHTKCVVSLNREDACRSSAPSSVFHIANHIHINDVEIP